MEAFAGIMLMGYRVREVWNLAERQILLPDHRLVLIDAGLSPRERELVATTVSQAVVVPAEG